MPSVRVHNFAISLDGYGNAGGDPAKVGVPAGYRWGYHLRPIDAETTEVTASFDCGGAGAWILEEEGGTWINGSTTVVTSLERTLERLAVSLEETP